MPGKSNVDVKLQAQPRHPVRLRPRVASSPLRILVSARRGGPPWTGTRTRPAVAHHKNPQEPQPDRPHEIASAVLSKEFGYLLPVLGPALFASDLDLHDHVGGRHGPFSLPVLRFSMRKLVASRKRRSSYTQEFLGRHQLVSQSEAAGKGACHVQRDHRSACSLTGCPRCRGRVARIDRGMGLTYPCPISGNSNRLRAPKLRHAV